jgi:hypothetical protein
MAFKRSGSGSPDKRNGRFLQRLGAENIFSEFQVQTSPVFEVSGCRPFDHVLRIINDGKKCTEWRDRCPRLKRRRKLQRASRWSNRERAERRREAAENAGMSRDQQVQAVRVNNVPRDAPVV